MQSLSARLLAFVSLLLLIFFSVTILALDGVFRTTHERAIRDLLETHLLALLAAAEPGDEHGLDLPVDLPEGRFSHPSSGLYGQLRDSSAHLVWRSPSAVGTEIAVVQPLAVGERRFGLQRLADGSDVQVLSLKVSWEFADASSREYTFSVAEDLASLRAQVARFRQQLFGWFLMLSLALLVSLGVLLRWVLSPLHRAEREVGEIESGVRQALGDGYPRELRGLTANMNALVAGERSRLQRYRETLDNLAHSLKTPLAVMRSLLGETSLDTEARRRMEEQIERMNGLVGYQLRRASAAGATGLGHAPIPVAETVERLLRALDKVYAPKAVQVERRFDGAVAFHGDEGDLTELIGNLLDNAYKWCRRRVRVSVIAHTTQGGAGMRGPWEFCVEDDGVGIETADRGLVLQRGTRLDERVDGQGIGLAVAGEIVEVQGGQIRIDRSALGGALFRVVLPGR